MSNSVIIILIGVGLCCLGIGLFIGGVMAESRPDSDTTARQSQWNNEEECDFF